jgi:hypothetical protein
LALIPAAASAQTVPTPTVTTTPTPGPTGVPQIPAKKVCNGVPQPVLGFIYDPKYLVPGANGGFSLEDEMHACSLEGQQQVHDQAKGFMNAMVPDNTGSAIPLSAYDIGFDGSITQGPALVIGIATAILFAVAVWIVAGGLTLVTWAVSFPFVSIGSAVADDVSKAMLTKVIGPIGLGHLALGICGVAVAFHLLRERANRAVIEVATCMVALVFASFLLTNPGALLRSGFRVEQQLMATLLTMGQPPAQTSVTVQSGTASTDAALAPLKKSVLSADVQNPYDLIDWGAVLTGRCAAIRDEALALGPWGDASAPRDTMAKLPECQAAATWNGNSSLSKLAGGGFSIFNSLSTFALLAVMALALLVSELGACFLMALSPLAIVAACVPKVRSGFARWAEGILRVILVTIVAAFFLSLWSLFMVALLDKLPPGTPLLLRFFVQACVTTMTIIAFVSALRRLPRVAHNVVKSMSKDEGYLSPAKSHGGTLGLGLGSLGMAEALGYRDKLSSLTPNRNRRKLVGAIKGLKDGPKELDAGEEFDPAGVGFPPWTPGTDMELSGGPYGDNKWRSDRVTAERVPPRTDNWTTPEVLREATLRLSNPLARPVIRLPESNPRKVVVPLSVANAAPSRRALPPAGSTSDAPVRAWETRRRDYEIPEE